MGVLLLLEGFDGCTSMTVLAVVLSGRYGRLYFQDGIGGCTSGRYWRLYFQDGMGCVEDGTGRDATGGGDAPTGGRDVLTANIRASQTTEEHQTGRRQKGTLIKVVTLLRTVVFLCCVLKRNVLYK